MVQDGVKLVCKYHIPVHTVSEANRRDHWAVRYKRAKEQRIVARAHTNHKILIFLDNPTKKYRLTLSRIGKRRMDSDNLAGSMKAVRDGIAQSLNINDGDPRIDWEYNQQKPSAKYVDGILVTLKSI